MNYKIFNFILITKYIFQKMQGNHEILFKNDQLAKIYQQNDKN